MPDLVEPSEFVRKQRDDPDCYRDVLRKIEFLNITPPRLKPPDKAIRLPALPPLHRPKKKKPRTNAIEESLSIAISAASHPTRTNALQETDIARERAHEELKQRREQKAKEERERNAAIAQAAREKLENDWQPYVSVLKTKGYTKRSILTFLHKSNAT